MKYEFAGISSNEEVNFDEHFDQIYDVDERTVFLSKRTFTHSEEELEFQYKYAIELLDFEAFDAGNSYCFSLKMVPTFDSIHKRHQEYLMELNQDYEGDSEDIWKYLDILDTLLTVVMGSENIDLKEDEKELWVDALPVKEKLKAIASTYLCIDMMRGFLIDRCWNRIGTTGWDTLLHAINNEPLFKKVGAVSES